jgi:hypothetical protein
VVIVMAVTSGDDEPERTPTYASTETDTEEERTPAPEPAIPDRPVKVTTPPTKAQMDVLEAGWSLLREKAARMRKLRDEGAAFWREEKHSQMQEKFRAANAEWQVIRDRSLELLSRFSDEQIEQYLGSYEREMIKWRKVFKTFSKHIAIED